MRKLATILLILLTLAGYSQSQTAEDYVNEAELYPGSFKSNILRYSKALQLDPFNLKALNGRIDCYFTILNLRNNEDQLYLKLLKDDINTYLSLDSLNSSIYYMLFSLCDQENDLKNGLVYLNKAISINPNKINWLEKRAAIFLNNAEYEKAIVDYKKIKKLLNSESDEGYKRIALSSNYRNSAMCYAKIGDFKKATKNIQKAISIHKTEYDNYLYKGNILTMMKEYEKALNVYTFIIDKNPHYSLAYLKRGRIYELIGKDDLAKKDLLIAEKNGLIK